MKSVSVAILLAAFGPFGPSEARACAIPARPEALRDLPADAIVLARVTAVERAGRGWHATARASATLSGSTTGRDFSFSDESHIVCGGMTRPGIGRHVILYLQRSDAGMRVVNASPYWWVRGNGDPRLGRLNAVLPLGPVREPTPAEARLIALTEPRVTLPPGETDLSRYTRIYARSSAGSVRVRLMRARTPRRLMVDDGEEMPTEAMCGCTLIEEIVDLADLWAAGRLPPPPNP